VEEYKDLTGKLHQFKSVEQNLIEKIQSLEAELEIKLHPKQQTKLFLRAHLPNQQRTSVQIIQGQRLRDALAKALSRRNMNFEMCEVYQTGSEDIPIPWDTDISTLKCDEISVKILDIVGFPTYISHQFIRKTFFSLAFCECCRRLLFTGFYCNQCNYRFHQRCVDKVPPLCSKLQMDTYYQLLLSETLGSTAGGFHRHPKTLNFENRSNSAPNVCVNSVLKPLLGGDHKILANSKCPIPLQTYSEHSHSTQASPTNTLKHAKRRQRARSADESNKILSPREQIQTGEDWNIDASEILMGPRIGTGSFGTVYKGEFCDLSRAHLNLHFL
jgi:B-Raf proto-oncogene serine/threonine-protein kinase